jgi:hypothetical protein
MYQLHNGRDLLSGVFAWRTLYCLGVQLHFRLPGNQDDLGRSICEKIKQLMRHLQLTEWIHRFECSVLGMMLRRSRDHECVKARIVKRALQ